MPPRFTRRSLATSTLPAITIANLLLAFVMVGQLFGSPELYRSQWWLLPIAGFFLLVFVLSRSSARPIYASDEKILLEYAYHDALTKLPNRLLLRDRLTIQLAAIRRSRISVAMLMIDLDEFKQINDALGHLAGDELLVQVAARISETCRDTDTVARLGGDEFAVIQAIEDPDQAAVLANRIIASLARPFDLAKGQVRVGCSIGITITQSSDIRLEELIDEADFALYRSKKRGGNVLTIFDRSADAFNRTDKSFETELIRALEGGNPAPGFFPQIDQFGLLAGVDARLVWDHRELGRLDLHSVLSLVHDRRLSRTVIEHYLQSVAETAIKVPTLEITFNMLPLLDPERYLLNQLCRDEFKLIRRAGPCFLSIAMADLERYGLGALAVIEELESHGYGLAIDCAESSPVTLRTVARMRPGRLRINSGLVSQIEISDHALVAVGDLCSLAHSLDIAVIADGVSTQEQSALLSDLRCDLQQGPLWGSGTDLGKLVNSWSARALSA